MSLLSLCIGFASFVLTIRPVLRLVCFLLLIDCRIEPKVGTTEPEKELSEYREQLAEAVYDPDTKHVSCRVAGVLRVSRSFFFTNFCNNILLFIYF